MSKPLDRGLYERLVTVGLESQLSSLASNLSADRSDLRPAEAGDRIALHLKGVIESAISGLSEKRRVEVGIELAHALIKQIVEIAGAKSVEDLGPSVAADVLSAVLARNPDGRPEILERPRTPLLDTTMLTNSPGEPNVSNQLNSEIPSAHRIDAVLAFILRSGLRPLKRKLEAFCESGKKLRVLTTTYTQSTEREALDMLRDLGADVRVSYEGGTTRLHAKAWLFHREGGFSTAYVGSSNLSHSALITGLEWNVRASQARNPDLIDKVQAVFESYWEGGDFVEYDPDEFDESVRKSKKDDVVIYLSPLEMKAEPFQQRLLDQLQRSRDRGYTKNLLVAATGTGKTVMAALDYARICDARPRKQCSLLFVAHRKEILDQSLATFRHALRDPSFGEKWVAGQRPTEFRQVFASIQSLTAAGLDGIDPRHFDMVIVDEFHHAAAKTYDKLQSHLEPDELLGLTATPERTDGLPVLHWFGDRIAAELRLWSAIDRHYLSPFHYYGIHDGLDLREVPWRRGRGYDEKALENVYTGNDVWARRVIQQLRDYVDDISDIRALGFCVSVSHADFMARIFRQHGIPAKSVSAKTDHESRRLALKRLREGEIKIIFAVDLFNEGVDLPQLDTLLFLRPTDSPTIYLQQLGRGLRRAKGKTVCTVLDFVGQHRREFRFDRKLRALLGGTRKDIESQVEQQFPLLPAGCHMSLDRVAQEEVLRSIRAAVPSTWPQRVQEMKAMVNAGHDVSLRNYLEHTGLELRDAYANQRSWSDLLEAANLAILESGSMEEVLRRALGRLLHVDDRERIDRWHAWITREQPPRIDELRERDRRLLRMLIAQMFSRSIDKQMLLQNAAALLWSHPQVRAEALELLEVLRNDAASAAASDDLQPDIPLRVHARYTRIEILAAVQASELARTPLWQTGVYFDKKSQTDLLAFTLDKTEGTFSPTTRYRDYAINRELIHWESQNSTSERSEKGQRYANHERHGSEILLFARLRQSCDFSRSWTRASGLILTVMDPPDSQGHGPRQGPGFS